MRTVNNCFFLWDRRTKLRVTANLAYLLLAMAGLAQQLQPPSLPTALPSALPSSALPASSPAATSIGDDKNTPKTSINESSVGLDPNGTLTASQIIAIVQARPELIVDIKQVMADYLEQQGSPVQVDSVTDDMLYRGIGSDAGLRGAISIWLRARGYVSETDFDRSDLDTQSSDDVAGNTGTGALRLPNPLTGGVTADSVRMIQIERKLVLPILMEFKEKEVYQSSPEGRDGSSAEKPDRNNPSATEVVHQTTPYNLQSLRDLYTQVPEQTSKLKRFGSDMFLNHGLDTKQMSVDIPIGPDYILGVGDGLLSIYGAASLRAFPRGRSRRQDRFA